MDDMIFTSDEIAGISSLKAFLSRQFEMKYLGLLNYFLGLEISQDFSCCFLSQAKYTSDLLACAGLTDCKTASTPIDSQIFLILLDGVLLSDASLYRQFVGSLVYFTITQPDIAYAVHIVSQFMVAPHFPHYDALLRILHYVKGTIFHGLHYSTHSSLELHVFSDADWAKDSTNWHSTTRFCFLLGTNANVSANNRTNSQQGKRETSFSDLGPLKDNERRDLNCAVKEYLLLAGYRPTAMTFYEEVLQL
ncbi:uncharacterized protein LOC114262539 [Camellia sinensis]|uniref:uncharacterized protein LOC114262539 n=1 Tax=Camellia sinensis TaxID=4442 RepID=UPI001035B1B6|nr:uncharacterized protein LOC114262539 [Camellia sinensis]